MLRCLAGRPMVIFGDGKQTRDFTFVSDTAAGILAAGLSDASIGQTLNLGSEKEIGIQLLARMISEVVGRPDAQILFTEPRPGDVVRLLSDSSKARELLNFKTTVKLRDGLACLRDGRNPGPVSGRTTGTGNRAQLGSSACPEKGELREFVPLGRPHLGRA